MRRLLLGILILGAAAVVEAQTSDDYPHIDIGIGPAFTWGKATENVYMASGSTSLLSQLIWPIPASIGAQATATIQWTENIQTTIQAKVFWALASGTMTDEDWMDENQVNYGSQANSRPDWHSDSRSVSTSNFEMLLEQGFPIKNDAVWFTPAIGFLYHHLSWTGWDTTQSIYSEATQTTSASNTYGQVIGYAQDWTIPFLGLNFEIKGPLSFALGIRFAPVVLATDLDNHIFSRTTYIDVLHSGWMLNPHASVEIRFDEKFFLEASFDVRTIQFARGDVYTATVTSGSISGVYTKSTDLGGAGLEMYTASVLFHVNL